MTAAEAVGRGQIGSCLVRSGELISVNQHFGTVYRELRKIVDEDGTLTARVKALVMAAVGAALADDLTLTREMRRTVELGTEERPLRQLALLMLAQRGESCYERFAAAVDLTIGPSSPPPDPLRPMRYEPSPGSRGAAGLIDELERICEHDLLTHVEHRLVLLSLAMVDGDGDGIVRHLRAAQGVGDDITEILHELLASVAIVAGVHVSRHAVGALNQGF